jgi:hypothetical protein
MRPLLTLAALAIAAAAWQGGGWLGEHLGLEVFDPLPRLALLLAGLAGFERVMTFGNGKNHAD